MRHFDIVEWTDWVRGFVSSRRRRAMADHLEAGCQPCGDMVHNLQRIVADAAGELEPPEYAVRAARALCGLGLPHRSPRVRRLPVRVVFDSLLQPALQGTRALESTNRHLVFNSRQYTIDTRLDYGKPGQSMSLVGQVVTRNGRPVPAVPAYLIAGHEILSQAFSNRLGEFQMECASEEALRLCLSIDERRLIEVDLERRSKPNEGAVVARWDFRRGRDQIAGDSDPMGLFDPPTDDEREH